ncbi:cytoplasmic tRNA 2-thiolation protein 2 isoform X2 [Latimeria chalumnae]|uniref:Cytoplasmic tRNA 2-thiolation protein 2 n=1 Tax=Latimeria chalumnae TaxID=7897 RepID=H3A072_LATCH|nr:PREDICTED: cytoplasmic tRNA 2-thiolation protein 2 isoform X2 [Latimeria chalumnae]|eukprot:XP_006008320.1 PREDICTED: cytoplasmic tRNA 2-thiolation protein 2 isoform X2 [Latimeria chalumnae]
MCQVEEDYKAAELEKKPVVSTAQKCMKCKEGSAVLIIRVGDAFCKDCFREYFTHKFRAMLGKNRLIYPGEKVLLAVSGGPSSSSLLRQVQEGLSREAPKKLRFVPGIVYVDEGGVCGQSLKERQDTIMEIESMCEACRFPYHIVYLEEVLSLPRAVLLPGSSAPTEYGPDYKTAVNGFLQQQRVKCTGEPKSEGESILFTEGWGQEKLAQLSTVDGVGEGDLGTATSASRKWPFMPKETEALRELFLSVKTLTAQEELLQTLRHHLILHTARVKGYSKVMMGDSCTRLAVKLLTNISLGRGAALAADTGFSDTRYGDVTIVRPMREYSSKEIAFYNRMFGVATVFTPALDTKASEKASIHKLTESFITKLQAEFPSTVSTIYRTSEKLNVAYLGSCPLAKLEDKCLLCLCTLDTKAEEASAFHAIQISEQLSQKSFEQAPAQRNAGKSCCGGNGEEECCQNVAGVCQSSDRSNTNSSFLALLCYGCRLTIKDLVSQTLLPKYILSEADCRKRRTQMKQKIQEFLLEDE